MKSMKNIGVLVLCGVSMVMHNTIQGMKRFNSDSDNAMVVYSSVQGMKRFNPNPDEYKKIESSDSSLWRKWSKNDSFSGDASFSEGRSKGEQLSLSLVQVKAVEQKNTYTINAGIEKKYACGKCIFTTNMPHSILVHDNFHAIMEINPRKRMYSCGQCGYLANRKKVMFNHTETHYTTNNYPCTIDGCDVSEKSERNLKLHVKWHHPEVKNSTPELRFGFSRIFNQQNPQVIQGYIGYGRIRK